MRVWRDLPMIKRELMYKLLSVAPPSDMKLIKTPISHSS